MISFWASARDEKITVLTEQLYPLSYTEDRKHSGVVKGYATELVKAVLDEAGLDYEIRMTPWSRIISTLKKQKNILAYSVARTTEREKQFFWIGQIISMKISLYGLRRNRNQLPETLDEAKTFRVAVNRASLVNDFLKANDFKNMIEIKSRDKYMILLERDRFDLFPLIDFALPLLAERENLDSTHYYPAVALSALTKICHYSVVPLLICTHSSDWLFDLGFSIPFRVIYSGGGILYNQDLSGI